jgi:hypothetical protein
MTSSIDEFKSTNNLTSKHRNEVLLQVTPLRIINEDGNEVTTYGLIESQWRSYSGPACPAQQD